MLHSLYFFAINTIVFFSINRDPHLLFVHNNYHIGARNTGNVFLRLLL